MHTFLISVHNFYFVLEIQKNRGEFTGFFHRSKKGYSTSDSSASFSRPLRNASHLRIQGIKMAKATRAAAIVFTMMASFGSSWKILHWALSTFPLLVITYSVEISNAFVEHRFLVSVVVVLIRFLDRTTKRSKRKLFRYTLVDGNYSPKEFPKNPEYRV